MTEGQVDLCSWSRTRGGYRVWLTSDPSIVAQHAEFDGADELFAREPQYGFLSPAKRYYSHTSKHLEAAPTAGSG